MKAMGNNKVIPRKTCQNCDFEEYCNHIDSDNCGRWRPDLECMKLIESLDLGEYCGNSDCPYFKSEMKCPATLAACAGFVSD